MPPSKKRPSKEDIVSKFHLPLADAAKELGICRTLLKRTCRVYDIPKWPFKKHLEGKRPSSPVKKNSTESNEEEEEEEESPILNHKSPNSFEVEKITSSEEEVQRNEYNSTTIQLDSSSEDEFFKLDKQEDQDEYLETNSTYHQTNLFPNLYTENLFIIEEEQVYVTEEDQPPRMCVETLLFHFGQI